MVARWNDTGETRPGAGRGAGAGRPTRAAGSALGSSPGEAAVEAGRWRGRASWAGILALALGLGACAGEAAPVPVAEGPLGEVRIALGVDDPDRLDEFDYTLRLIDLESAPPEMYAEVTTTSPGLGGSLLERLACRASRDAERWTQVEAEAVVRLDGGTGSTVAAEARTAFRCGRDAETRVSLTLKLTTAWPERCGGFIDCDWLAAGTVCTSKVDFVSGGDEGCVGAACGAPGSTFLFASVCHTLSGSPPRFWTCGAPTAWDIGQAANQQAVSAFTMPDADGTWTFGLVALDPGTVAASGGAEDEEAGERRVWRDASLKRARLERVGGEIVRAEVAGNEAAFVVALEGPAIGDAPAARVLVSGIQDEGTVAVRYQGVDGPCDRPVEGTARFEGFALVDVRLEGVSTATLLLADRGSRFVTDLVTCEVGRDEASAPVVTCGAPEPLF